MSSQAPPFVPGLEGVVAAQTRLSSVDGQVGQLLIAGFPVEILAHQATFEETVYLLWHDALPSAEQHQAFCQALVEKRALPQVTLNLIEQAAQTETSGIDVLRLACDSLSLTLSPQINQSASQDAALTIIAAFPTIVAAYWRLRQGLEPISPDSNLGHVANYLYILFGEIPHPERVRALETYFNTVVDHGLNASTFAARVIIATQSDMVSAIVGALGALKGPLHGGAPGPALDMVFDIGQAEEAEAYLRQKLDRGERLMGFGHRVYKVRDPRADVLSAAAAQLYQADGDMALYQLARHVEKMAVALLAEYKPQHQLQTNVEFYTALLLHGLGLSTELFTPTFALARCAGWTAHCFEQDRLIRPRAMYVGPKNRTWVSLAQRT